MTAGILETRQILRSRDPAAIRDATGALTVGHEISVLRAGRRIDGLVNGVGLDRVNVVYVRYGAPVDVEAPGTRDRVALTLPLGPMRVARAGQKPFTSIGGFVLDDARPTVMTPDPRAGALVIAASRKVLEEHAALLCGGAIERPLRFDDDAVPAAVPPHAADAMWRWALVQLDALGGHALVPAARRHLEDLVLTSVLLTSSHSASPRLRAELPEGGGASPAAIEHAREYLEHHYAEHLSTADLARVAGTSVRYLQAGFRRHYGATPMEVLREARLQHARAALLRRGERTVADIAVSCGFTHLGRFAGLYRARFGVSPSQVDRR